MILILEIIFSFMMGRKEYYLLLWLLPCSKIQRYLTVLLTLTNSMDSLETLRKIFEELTLSLTVAWWLKLQGHAHHPSPKTQKTK